MYRASIEPNVDNTKKIYKMKIALKTKVFCMVFLEESKIFTKDNLLKHKWHESTKCVFYHRGDTNNHLFFRCKFSRYIC
jgi:hypothetical protein